MKKPQSNDLDPRSITRVREGHGANCSSVGSVVDTLFLSAVAGGAVLAAVAAALKREPITLVADSQDIAKNGADAREEPRDAT